MATPRSMIVDESVTPFYHCVSQCVRRAFLCGEGAEHRKQWIENRVKELVGIFTIDCAGYAIMDNHLDRAFGQALNLHGLIHPA